MEDQDLQFQPSEPHDPALPYENPWIKARQQQDRCDAAYREGWRWGFWSILLPPIWIINFILAVLEYSHPDAEDKYRGRGRFKGIVSAFFVIIGLAVITFIGVSIKTHMGNIEAQRIAELRQVADNERMQQEAERQRRKELEKQGKLEEAERERQHREKSEKIWAATEEARIAREKRDKKERELREAEKEQAIRDREEALKKTKLERIIKKALKDSEDRIVVVAKAKEKYSLANKRIEAAKKIMEVSVSKLITYKNRMTGAKNRNETALERENRLRDIHGTKANIGVRRDYDTYSYDNNSGTTATWDLSEYIVQARKKCIMNENEIEMCRKGFIEAKSDFDKACREIKKASLDRDKAETTLRQFGFIDEIVKCIKRTFVTRIYALKDGRKIESSMAVESDGKLTIKTLSGSIVTVDANEIQSVNEKRTEVIEDGTEDMHASVPPVIILVLKNGKRIEAIIITKSDDTISGRDSFEKLFEIKESDIDEAIGSGLDKHMLRTK